MVAGNGSTAMGSMGCAPQTVGMRIPPGRLQVRQGVLCYI